MCASYSRHEGNEVRQETSGHFLKRGPLQSIDGRRWKWKTLISCREKTRDEHINTLEVRAILLLEKEGVAVTFA